MTTSPTGDTDPAPRPLDDVVEQVLAASAAEHAMPASLLEGYLAALWEVARTGRRLNGDEEASCRRLGGEAAAAGLALPALVDLYMTASRRLWPRLPDLVAGVRGRPLRSAELISIGEFVWRAADTALAALASGYVEAQRQVVRREEAFRREFVEDLLSGQSDVGSLVERAESFGLTLTAPHVVTVAATEQPVDSGMQGTGGLADDVRARFGDRGFLAAAKDGRLVCVLALPSRVGGRPPAPGASDLAELAGRAAGRLTRASDWRVGVGRAHVGPGGVRRSYREALEAIDLAERLALPQPVVHARDLLVYRVLIRDEAAMADLVEAVLGPLASARGGTGPLLRTVEAWFASGGNTAETARRLHLSVRAVSYRLQRVAELTGHTVDDAEHRLALHVAVTGARLLDWPRRPLVAD